jgi:hypothetical protein
VQQCAQPGVDPAGVLDLVAEFLERGRDGLDDLQEVGRSD